VSVELDLGFSSNFVVCDGKFVRVWSVFSIVATYVAII